MDRAPSLTLPARILLNSAIQLLGRLGSGLGGLIVVAVLTRYLGQRTFGAYTFVTGYVSLFYVITDLGANSLFIREMARNPKESPVLAGLLFSLRSVLVGVALVACLSAAFLLPTGPFLDAGIRPAIAVAAVALLWNPLFAVSTALFQTSLRMTFGALTELSTRAGGLAFLAILVLLLPVGNNLPLRLFGAASMSTVGLLAGALVARWAAFQIAPFRPRWNWPFLRRLLADAAPLAIVTVLGSIHYRIDVLILSVMSNLTTVGTYGIATKMLDAFISGSGIFMGLVFPVLSSRTRGDSQLLRRAFQKALDLMLIASVGAAVFVFSFAAYAVRILGGAQYHAAAAPVAAIAWAIPVIFTGTVFSQMVVAANRQGKALLPAIAAIVINVALNILLIPRFGAVAPATVTVISEGLSTAGIGVVMVRHYGFGPDARKAAGILASAALSLVTIHVTLPAGTIPAALAGALAYALALLLVRAVTVADVRSIVTREPRTS